MNTQETNYGLQSLQRHKEHTKKGWGKQETNKQDLMTSGIHWQGFLLTQTPCQQDCNNQQ